MILKKSSNMQARHYNSIEYTQFNFNLSKITLKFLFMQVQKNEIINQYKFITLFKNEIFVLIHGIKF
jgi:hypothetical protein